MIGYFALALGPFAAALVVYMAGGSAHVAGALGILLALQLFLLVDLVIRRQKRTWREFGHDVVHALLSSGTAQICLVASTTLLGFADRATLDWALFVQVACIVIGTDFLGYWAHRAQHRVEMLWSGHALHHTPDKLYWLNGLRAHPTDTAWVFGAATLWTFVAGFSLEAFALASVIQTSYLLLQHTEIAFPRSLERVFVTPGWHRVHHHADEECANLGHVLTVWDRLFGTYVASSNELERLGVDGVEPATLVDELALPFRN